MLSPPDDLTESTLAAALTREWGVAVAALAYQRVGFGSHHWSATDPAGRNWFVTVDDLETLRQSRADPLDAAHRRLGAALDAARALRDAGAKFVVAPVPTAGGATISRVRSGTRRRSTPTSRARATTSGEFAGDDHRDAVLAMIRDVHAAPDRVRRHAPWCDDFGVPHRDALETVLDGTAAIGSGPYAERTAELIADHAEDVRALLARYDAMVARADRSRAVLTHGEPHAANTMRTGDGWLLIDWETALLAPPERDLWGLGPEVAAGVPGRDRCGGAAGDAGALPAALGHRRPGDRGGPVPGAAPGQRRRRRDLGDPGARPSPESPRNGRGLSSGSWWRRRSCGSGRSASAASSHPLGALVARQGTTEHYVDENDRVLFDDTVGDARRPRRAGGRAARLRAGRAPAQDLLRPVQDPGRHRHLRRALPRAQRRDPRPGAGADLALRRAPDPRLPQRLPGLRRPATGAAWSS